MKAVLLTFGGGDVNSIDYFFAMYDNSNNLLSGFTTNLPVGTGINPSMPGATLQANIEAMAIAGALANGYTITASDIIWNGYCIYTPSQLGDSLSSPTVNNSPGRSLVTTAAAANGFQVSATRPSLVTYSITIVSTASLSGNQAGYDVLEICPTNSSVAANWIEISRISNGQSIALAIALTAVSTGGGALFGTVPAGYYARIHSVNVSGTPTHTMNSSQESVL